jgi:hypothetical protein
MAIEIPPEVGAEERRQRQRHIDELKRHAAAAPAEHSRYLTATAAKVARSMPVRDFVERRRELRQKANAASSTVEWDNGKATSVAGSFRAMVSALEAGNAYEPGLVEAVENRLLGKVCLDPALSPVVEAVAGKGH